MQPVWETLAANGPAEHVAPWLSNASKLPISPAQIASALGSGQVQQMAAASALHLPQAASDAAGSVSQ